MASNPGRWAEDETDEEAFTGSGNRLRNNALQSRHPSGLEDSDETDENAEGMSLACNWLQQFMHPQSHAE